MASCSPGLPLADVAMPRTEVAVQAPVRHGLPPASGMMGGLEDGEHEPIGYSTAVKGWTGFSD